METTPTHSVTKPNKPPLTSLQQFRGNLNNKEFTETIEDYYRGDKLGALAFKAAAIDYIRHKPKLLECDRMSLLSSLIKVAQFRFMPSGISGEACIIPYGKEATFQLGYQGLITLMYRSGKVKTITSNIIYKNDDFEYEEGLGAKLIHHPSMFGKPKGEPIGVYTIVQMAGGEKTFKVMDKDAVMGIKAISKAKDKADSPWNSNDPELWMWKKTCLIQHSKMLPKTQDIMKAIEKDYEGEGIDKPVLDAGGPAVGASVHTTDTPDDSYPPETGNPIPDAAQGGIIEA